MSWWEKAKPGDKVVSVVGPDWNPARADTWTSWARGLRFVRGRVYTIRLIGHSETYDANGCRIYIETEEIPGLARTALFFRPVQPQAKGTEAAMRLLRGLLTGAPVSKPAPMPAPMPAREDA
jgi:hypothetical protein